MRLLSSVILILLLIVNALSQTRTGGVSPTYKIPALPYINTQHITLTPSTFGTVSLVNSANPYTHTVTFDKLMPSVNQSNLITTGFSSPVNSDIAYSIVDTLTNSNTASQINITIIRNSSLYKLSLLMMRIMDALIQGNIYINFFQLEFTDPSVTRNIHLPYFTGYQIYTPIKYMSIIRNDTLPANPQSQGFVTKHQIIITNVTDVTVIVRIQKEDPAANFFMLSAKVVVIVTNPPLHRTSAQFSALNIIVQQDFATSGVPVTIQDYSQVYKSNLLIGIESFTQTNPQSSVIDFVMGANSITFTTNNLDSRHKYLFVQFADYTCQEDFKYKNDSLCYKCTMGTQVLINDILFTEYHNNVAFNGCNTISRTHTGYKFNQFNGQISAICAYCKLCDPQYFLQSGKCYQCRVKMPNCQECSNSVTCTKCSTGFNLVDPDANPATNNSYCQPVTVTCGLHCLQCNANASSCTKCDSQYTLADPDADISTANSYCKAICSSNCLQCNDNASSCYKCSTGYALFDPDSNILTENSVCKVICSSNCLQCASDGASCNKCQTGYALFDPDLNISTINSVCKKVVCSSKCLECTSEGASCTKCSDGYKLFDSDGNSATLNSICTIQCSSNCFDCSQNPNSCNICEAGFILVKPSGNSSTVVNVCQNPCSSNCLSCNKDASSCIVCEAGYQTQVIDKNDSVLKYRCAKMSETNLPASQNSSLTTIVVGCVVGAVVIIILLILIRRWCSKGQSQKNTIYPVNIELDPNVGTEGIKKKSKLSDSSSTKPSNQGPYNNVQSESLNDIIQQIDEPIDEAINIADDLYNQGQYSRQDLELLTQRQLNQLFLRIMF